MRHIGELDDSMAAAVFAAYLVVKEIDGMADPLPGGGAEIWIKDEDQFEEARRELEAYKADPDNAKYSRSLVDAKAIMRADEKKWKRIQKKIVPAGAGNFNRRPPLTLTLIGLCVLVGLLTDFGDFKKTRPDHVIYQALQFVSVSPPESIRLRQEYGNDPDNLGLRLASIRKGQIWRLATPIFVHYGIWHLVFNMYWMYLFGSVIERRYGSLKLGGLILAAAAVSNLVQCTVPIDVGGMAPGFFDRSETAVLITALGGMSGVVYGLFGFVWMKMIHDPKSGFRMPMSTIVILMVWLFLCMVPDMFPNMDPSNPILSIVGGHVANWAHAAGLLAGMAIGYGTAMMGRR